MKKWFRQQGFPGGFEIFKTYIPYVLQKYFSVPQYLLETSPNFASEFERIN